MAGVSGNSTSPEAWPDLADLRLLSSESVSQWLAGKSSGVAKGFICTSINAFKSVNETHRQYE